jgi:nitrite reductase (NADH) large subunit
MTTMESKRYVIIGGSAAGMAAAQAIRDHDPRGTIQVLSEEADAPYFRPMIPFIISRKKEADQIYLQGRGPYQARDIELRLKTRAARIDATGRRVITDQGEAITYDRLLIATGSRPHIPADIEGIVQEGVFALRTIEDARQAAQRARNTRHAVMLGGGLLNLKAAFALLERGIRVTLLVFSPQGNRLVGALFVGDIARAGLYRAVIQEGLQVGAIKKQVIAHRLHYGHLLCAGTTS